MILALLAVAALQPEVVASVPPQHRLVEGVATDGRTIWVSSVFDRTILACRAACRPVAVLPPVLPPGLHPLGIAWDAQRKRLWVAADCPELPGIAKCERGALLALDRKGRVRTKLSPEVGDFHPGDVSAHRGRVFVSDSQTGMVRSLGASGRTLMAVVLPGAGKSAQGTALDPSGKRLIVADYSLGIAAVDLATWRRTLLPRQDGKPLRGIDGLVRCGGTYFGIYNGAAPGRLISFTLTTRGIEYKEVIESLTLPDPTQIAFDGRRLLVVANAGWQAAAKPPAPRAAPAPVIAIPLGRDCRPL